RCELPVPRPAHDARGKRRRRATAGNEPRDDEDVTAALLEEALGPLEPFARALAAEEALDHRLPDPAPDRIRRVVAEERSDRAENDHPRERELTAPGLDAADDHRRLARQRREHRVARTDAEQNRIRPQRPGQQVDQAVQERDGHSRTLRSSTTRVWRRKPMLSYNARAGSSWSRPPAQTMACRAPSSRSRRRAYLHTAAPSP